MGNNNKQQMSLNININALEAMKCLDPECDSIIFAQVISVRRLPALMSPTGEGGIAEVPIGLTCVKCGATVTKTDFVKAALAPKEELSITKGD